MVSLTPNRDAILAAIEAVNVTEQPTPALREQAEVMRDISAPIYLLHGDWLDAGRLRREEDEVELAKLMMYGVATAMVGTARTFAQSEKASAIAPILNTMLRILNQALDHLGNEPADWKRVKNVAGNAGGRDDTRH